jgi:hypothetical protein
VVCGQPITEKSSPKEPVGRFMQRATCSQACGHIHQSWKSRGPRVRENTSYRQGALVEVDFGGRFGVGNVAPRPDPRPLPRVNAARSYSSVASAWLL